MSDTPTWKKALRLPYDAVQDYVMDDGPSLAAALSFYALLSLAPMLLVVTEVAGWWLGTEAAIDQLRTWSAELVRGEAQQAVDQLLDQLADQELIGSSGVWGWVGGIATLFVATTLVAQLQNGLNRIWRMRPDPERRDVLIFAMKRGISLAIVLVTIAAVIVSAVLSTAVETALTWATGLLPGSWEAALTSLSSTALSWLILAVVITLGFQVLPDARIRWRDAAIGGAFTAALVQVGSFLLAWYLGVAAVGSAWGASGTVAVFLVWVFYVANILLLGAELTRCWALCFGGGVSAGRFGVGVRYEIIDEGPRSDDPAEDGDDTSDDAAA